jgi:hypothetical protein
MDTEKSLGTGHDKDNWKSTGKIRYDGVSERFGDTKTMERRKPKQKTTPLEEAIERTRVPTTKPERKGVERKMPKQAQNDEQQDENADAIPNYDVVENNARTSGRCWIRCRDHKSNHIGMFQRRYYVGTIQIAYVRKTVQDDQYYCFLTNNRQRDAVYGRGFAALDDVEAFLIEELES